MNKILRITIVIIILVPIFGFPQEIVLNESAKKEVIIKVASIIKEQYVIKGIGSKMSKHILNQHETGKYDSLIKVSKFCSRLTSDLREIENDKHLYVFYSPEEAKEVRAFKKLLPENEAKKINEAIYEIERKENFGFKKIEILDGNIGYLDLRYFASPDIFDEKLIGVMNFLSNTDAVIIDLRNNGGGQGSSLFFSYFLAPEEILLGCSYCRDTTQNTNSKTKVDIPGKRLTNIDLYILTSSRTFSAAEDFAYTMKNLNRATIIGGTTKGGAHPIDIFVVKGDILTQIPICESYNPITKTNWEGVGVVPNIEVSSEIALQKAQIFALEKIITRTSDIEQIKSLKLMVTELKKILKE